MGKKSKSVHKKHRQVARTRRAHALQMRQRNAPHVINLGNYTSEEDKQKQHVLKDILKRNGISLTIDNMIHVSKEYQMQGMTKEEINDLYEEGHDITSYNINPKEYTAYQLRALLQKSRYNSNSSNNNSSYESLHSNNSINSSVESNYSNSSIEPLEEVDSSYIEYTGNESKDELELLLDSPFAHAYKSKMDKRISSVPKPTEIQLSRRLKRQTKKKVKKEKRLHLQTFKNDFGKIKSIIII